MRGGDRGGKGKYEKGGSGVGTPIQLQSLWSDSDRGVVGRGDRGGGGGAAQGTGPALPQRGRLTGLCIASRFPCVCGCGALEIAGASVSPQQGVAVLGPRREGAGARGRLLPSCPSPLGARG
jgi:hypothetical protein